MALFTTFFILVCHHRRRFLFSLFSVVLLYFVRKKNVHFLWLLNMFFILVALVPHEIALNQAISFRIKSFCTIFSFVSFGCFYLVYHHGIFYCFQSQFYSVHWVCNILKQFRRLILRNFCTLFEIFSFVEFRAIC